VEAGDVSDELPVIDGVVAGELAEEFPGLAVRTVTLDGVPGPSTPGGRLRLAGLANRISGAQALLVRGQEVPHAYRVFFRHVGIDPDISRTPVEAAILDRLVDGGFPPRDRIADGCLAAVVETGVPVWAADAARIAGPITLRPARAGEPLGEGTRTRPPDTVPAGRLLLADDDGPLAPLFGEVLPERRPTPGTRRIRLFTIQVPGVSDLHVREALWSAATAVQDVESS
jgi:DNA/RNA-binding domain of Phe-tRNA-synthetase-like protein